VIRKPWKLFRRLSDLVNVLPLAGKIGIRPVLLALYVAPANKRFRNFVIALAYLMLMVWGALFPIYNGLDTLSSKYSTACASNQLCVSRCKCSCCLFTRHFDLEAFRTLLEDETSPSYREIF
jgi:hypothetical protein